MNIEHVQQMYNYVGDMSLETASLFVSLISQSHGILAWNVTDKILLNVESVSVNGSYIQLNLEGYKKND